MNKIRTYRVRDKSSKLMKNKKERKNTGEKRKDRAGRVTVYLLVVVVLLGGFTYLYGRGTTILKAPGDLFANSSDDIFVIEKAEDTDTNDDSLKENTDIEAEEDAATDSETDKITNILLLGIDRTPSGGTTSGTMPHADAIMVVAINFTKNEVSLVSLPRDSFVNMPSVKGFYKLNGMFNVGGGYDAPNSEGFLMMCEAAEWILGGISVDYYYSVDFEALIDLVDAIGGVDFDMDMNYSNGDGRYYTEGMQHLDGRGVFDYLQARRNASTDASDSGRVNRQKKMMIVVFETIKESNMLATIPQLISSIDDGLYTNTTTEQTLALANYARNIDASSIESYSLYGEYKAGPIAWNWTFVDPDNRIAVIKEVWGVTVSPLECTSFEFMTWLHDYGLSALKYLSTAEIVGNYAAQLNTLTMEQRQAYTEYLTAHSALEDAYEQASRSMSDNDTQLVVSAQETLKEQTENLAEVIGFDQILVWEVGSSWCDDSGINEIYVDFR